MKLVPNTDPKVFQCSKTDVEKITIEFTPTPSDCLGRILFCFNQDCADPNRVTGNKIVFDADEENKLIQISIFFKPGSTGKCVIKITSSTGQTFSATVTKSSSGVVLREREYVFSQV